jgi:group I intron endonuclease
MEVGKIYKISNNFDEKLYIGQTWCDLEKRFKQHCKPRSHCPKLKNSIQAHGKENFTIELLWEGECTQAELDEYEIEMIGLFNTLSPFGYNLQEGGRGGKPSDETRAKISAACTNPSLESRAKMSAAKKGCVASTETRSKMSAAHKGRVVSTETREKLSAANKGRVVPTEIRVKISNSQNNSVEQWSRDGKIFIKMFESLKLAAHATGTNRSGISMNLSGKQKTAGGFFWRRVKSKNDV